MDALLGRRSEETRRIATQAEEEWLDMMLAEQERHQEACVEQQENMRLDLEERYQMLEDLQQGSTFFLHSELAERTSYPRLLAIRHSAQQLVNLIDQTLYNAVQSERDAARRQIDNMHKEINSIMCEERSQMEMQLARHKEAEEDLLHLLEEEQERMTCRICFGRPRNVIVLPCMHFDYCSECVQQHQLRSTTCPTCRGPISGTLKCNLSF